jgi:hypothetical protein
MNKNEDPNIARLSSDTPAGRLMLLRELGPQPVFDEDGNVIGETELLSRDQIRTRDNTDTLIRGGEIRRRRGGGEG